MESNQQELNAHLHGYIRHIIVKELFPKKYGNERGCNGTNQITYSLAI